MNKMLTVDVGRCTGCHTCEFMCSFQHHDEFNPRKARIHTTVFLHDELAVPGRLLAVRGRLVRAHLPGGCDQ